MTDIHMPALHKLMPSIPTRKLIIALLTACLVTLAGCGPVRPDRPVIGKDPDAQVRELVSKGKLADAIYLLKQLAQKASPPARQDYQLKTAGLMLRSNQLEPATRLLTAINTSGLDAAYGWRKNLLLARIALLQKKPEQVLQTVKVLPVNAPAELRRQAHRLRAQAYQASGNLLESARERVLLDPLLSEPSRQVENSQAIWTSLTQLSALALQQLRINPPPDIFSGWLELAWVIKKARLAPGTLETRIQEWRSRYPGHPADKGFLAVLLAKQKQLQKRPAVIALFLPLSGPYAPAAKAIRNGFLAAHFNNRKAAETTRIKIYDSWPHQKDIRVLYELAVKDGASVIVGPLSKQAVASMAKGDALKIPVLALNIADYNASQVPANLYQFGLSPEDEARQIAERAALEGHTRAVVIVPRSNWGKRILDAFTARFTKLGGEVLESELYFENDSDFSGPLKRLFNIDESRARLYRLKRITGRRDIKFEPRRRQDIDFIFMAARPRQARLIVPQIRFHHGGGIPVYATSHAWNGVRDASADRDMNGITICDSPWTLSAAQKPDSLYRLLTRYWPKALQRHLRLYALGIDAYNIVPYLGWLRKEPYERFSGESGSLYVDKQGRVLRRLQWAKFSGGIAQLIKQPVNVKNTPGKTGATPAGTGNKKTP